MPETEREPTDYPRYRARLVNVVYGFWTVYKLWGEWVRLDEWKEFSGERLSKKYRPGVWQLVMARSRRLTKFEIEGIDELGRPTPLSLWRLKELGKQRPSASFRGVDAIAGELQRVPGVGVGELTFHLREHEGLSPALAVGVLQRLGYADVKEIHLAKKRGDGQDRARRGMPCRPCNPDEYGRMRNKSEAVR